MTIDRRIRHRWRRSLTGRHDGLWFVWTAGVLARARAWRRSRRAPAEHPFGTIGPAELDGSGSLVRRTPVAEEIRVTLPPVRPHRRIDLNPTWGSVRRTPAREVLVLRHAQVFGWTGWVGAQGKVLESLGNAYFLPEWQHRTHLGQLAPGPTLPGRSVSLTQLGFHNYFHWMVQGLPRLATVLAALGGPTAVDRFLHAEPVRPFIAETLERLGVSLDRLHPIQPHERVTCEELACGTIVRDDDVIPLEHLDLVRGLFAEVLAPSANDIVYVSRSRSERRRVVNEDEVRAAVARAGGRTVESGGRSVAEQAGLFSGARVLVGVHGADLTNGVWMPTTSALVEVLPANLTAAPFATLCRSRGMAYDFTVGVEAALPRWMHVGLNRGDVRVDVADLERRLAAMC